MKRLLVAALLSTWLVAAFPQSGDVKIERDPAAQTNSKKTIGDFSGWLLVTLEEDLADELDVQPGDAPGRSGGPLVHIGEPVLILIFYANPALKFDRVANVQCDVKVVRPDQTVSMDKTGVACMKSRLAEGKDDMYLPGLILRLIPQPTDQKGEWNVAASLRDIVRGTEMSLQASFTLD